MEVQTQDVLGYGEGDEGSGKMAIRLIQREKEDVAKRKEIRA